MAIFVVIFSFAIIEFIVAITIVSSMMFERGEGGV